MSTTKIIDKINQTTPDYNNMRSWYGFFFDKEFDNLLEKKINHYNIRKWIRPGLSGWAQVNLPYTSSIEDSKIKLSYDLFYLRNFSFWLDMLIFLKTIKILLHIKGSTPKS